MKTKLLCLLLVFSLGNAQVTDGLIQEFKFNNTLVSESGNANFQNTSGVTFGEDRFGNVNSAVVKTFLAAPWATITNLPTGTSARTISVWMKPTGIANDNIIFTYGTASGLQAYGASFNSTTMFNFSYTTNLSYATANLANVWKHVLVTFDTTGVATLYINGTFANSGTYAWNTGNNNNFYLGSLFGTTSSAFVGSFDDLKIYNRNVTQQEVAQIYNEGIPLGANALLQEFKFDNSYANEGNTISFNDYGTGVASSFTSDRNSVANNAVLINEKPLKAVIPNLPNSDSTRSISLWVQPLIASNDGVIFSYGNPSGETAYGLSFNNQGSIPQLHYIYNFSFGTNISSNSTMTGVWNHFVVTFDGNRDAKMYRNGVLIAQGNRPNWNTNAASTFFEFHLGKLLYTNSGNFVGAIDDLKIYNYALSQADVTSLYTNNTLASTDFNQDNLEVALYPNPVRDFLKIETVLQIKSVEIYNIQGQKVLSSNQKQIDVTHLPSGVYMVRIADTSNKVSLKKIIVE